MGELFMYNLYVLCAYIHFSFGNTFSHEYNIFISVHANYYYLWYRFALQYKVIIIRENTASKNHR